MYRIGITALLTLRATLLEGLMTVVWLALTVRHSLR